MKNWCCLCFSEEEEYSEGEEPEEIAMKETGFENEGSMGFFAGEAEDATHGGGGGAREYISLFGSVVEVERGGGDGATTSLRTSRRSKGESSSASSAAAAVVSEDCDHDSHHKRAKVHSDFQ